jgi:hypothetical protein
VHCSGTLIQFDSTRKFKTLSNDFYLVHDTIAWGEPLANFKLGSWKVNNDKIISESRYIEGSATELLGKQVVDTFIIRGDTLITGNLKKYIRVKSLTKELSELFERDWSQFDKKNGK